MAKEWNSSKLVEALTAAGTKGVTKSALEGKLPKAIRSKSVSILSELRSAGSIKGPFKKRSDYYFAPQFAPTRAQAEGLIEELLRDAGLRLTTKTYLCARANGFLQVFFKDALAALKSEAKILELRRGQSAFYVHREAVLEQLRLTDPSEAGPPEHLPSGHVTMRRSRSRHVRPIYERLKAEQGGISTVKIYDIMTRLGAAKEDLHRLLLNEAKSGRVSLHRASSAKFSPDVIEAGIRLEGQTEPLVTIVLKEEP
jgi:hypothetical protein